MTWTVTYLIFVIRLFHAHSLSQCSTLKQLLLVWSSHSFISINTVT